jgi:hypothetical protein
MATPSATQYHGTIVVAIVAGVVIMAVAASLSIRGIGPFDGTAVSFVPDPPDAVVVTVSVTNQGTREGRAKCQLTARDLAGRIVRTRPTVSPAVPPGATITFEERLPGLTTAPASVEATCS